MQNLFDHIKRMDIKDYTLEKAVGITRGSIANWKAGRCKPGVDALVKLADYFGVSLDYFLGRESPAPVTPLSADMAEVFDRLPRSHQQRVIGYATCLAERA